MNRNYVYAFPSVHNTTNVVNYSGDPYVNSFLSYFDIWGSNGYQKLCSDNNHSAFWFECSKDFFDMLHKEEFSRAFQRMNTQLTFDETDIVDID